MSHNNFIKNCLNIKENNLIFFENEYKEEVIKGVKTVIIPGKLLYDSNKCMKCGCEGKVVKNGFKVSNIIVPKIMERNTILRIKKQRILCRECKQTFIPETRLVNKNCFISNTTKLAITVTLSKKISEKDISERFFVSHSTVNRIVDSMFEDFKPNFNYLPPHLCFDEFKSVKEADGAMSFIFCDSTNSKIIDIVEDRKLTSLRTYFSKFSINSRNSVKTIVVDMHSPYISLITELFPKTKLVIDRFHIVQLISRELNKLRINVMNSFKNKEKPHYTKFKKYWRLFLKDSLTLNYQRYYNKYFHKYISHKEIIDFLLSLNKDLETAYIIYQNLLYAVKNKNFDIFQYTIKNKYDAIPIGLKKSLKTLKKYENYIKNSLKLEFSNGRLEGINNKIKVIKRISFGFKSFHHFKNRILICNNLLQLKGA